MNPATRKALTEELSALSVEIAADLRQRILDDPTVRQRAEALHAAERVGQGFRLWTDLLSRRAAVMWVLRSVYLRVLEDRGLLRPGRILDRESELLFHRLAPDLGETAYFRWIYRDLAKKESGLTELFALTPAEVTEPSDALSRKLLDFWRDVDPDTNELRWRFDQEDFDSRLLGDLYQDLDPVVKQRYALLQTPDFVVDFILDETLTPAIEHWDIETVRLIDPACGSGHFLLAGFDRLFTGLRQARPDLSPMEAAQHVLSRVVGIDLNDYACALARARLLMYALELAGSTDLSNGADLHPQIFWADGLDQVELEADAKEPAGEIQQLGFGDDYGVGVAVSVKDKPAAMLTPREVREQLRPVLAEGFHAVVANPPYITEKDKARKKYHKEEITVGGQKQPRYVSAYRLYSLGCPFTERCFQLAVTEDKGGYVGLITANSFSKRSFGAALIERFFPTVTLTMIVDTAGAYIPGHGTPTVMIFGRASFPNASDLVRTVLGKRGEPSVPVEPSEGLVWSSIEAGYRDPDFENQYISVDDSPNRKYHSHPWSLRGGGASRLQSRVEEVAAHTVGELADAIGFMCITKMDDAFSQPLGVFERRGCSSALLRLFGVGENIRNWCAEAQLEVLFPYTSEIRTIDIEALGGVSNVLWPYRRLLEARKVFGGAEYRDVEKPWWEYGQISADRFTPRTIVFAELATHNHFALDQLGTVFNQAAPVIKMPPEVTEDEHYVLLGQLNSSTSLFWLKQVCFDKGTGGIGGGIASEGWERRAVYDSTKMQAFPVVELLPGKLDQYARRMDLLASERVMSRVRDKIDQLLSEGPVALRSELLAHRSADLEYLKTLVAIQEELDWYCYALYNVDPGVDFSDSAVASLGPDEAPPIRPGLRAFEIRLARLDHEIRGAHTRDELRNRIPTKWFSRHGWDPVTDTAEIEDEAYRARVEARLALIEKSKALQLLEQPTYKRRWYKPDYEAEEREALDGWLADRLEDWAKEQAAPWTLAQAAVALEGDAKVRAVCEVRTGRPDYSLVGELERLVAVDSVPNNKHHVYKPKGLEKRAAWERTWELQHAEDRGEEVEVPVPPKYRSAEFQKTAYWRLRGKLDVPKERFIAFTEVPGAEGDRALYGWAGWTPLQRAEVLLGLYERAANEGLALERCYGLLYGVWFLLPWVAWEDQAAAEEFRAVVQDLVGEQGVTEALLAQWAEAG